jgi:hypothetical protein
MPNSNLINTNYPWVKGIQFFQTKGLTLPEGEIIAKEEKYTEFL